MDKNICIRLEADAKQIMQCRETIKQRADSFTSLSEVLNLSGNPVRLKILYLLSKEGRLCVCDLSDILSMNVSAISQHLRKLRDRKLIFSEKEAQTIFYSISENQMHILNPFFEIIDSNVLTDVK